MKMTSSSSSRECTLRKPTSLDLSSGRRTVKRPLHSQLLESPDLKRIGITSPDMEKLIMTMSSPLPKLNNLLPFSGLTPCDTPIGDGVKYESREGLHSISHPLSHHEHLSTLSIVRQPPHQQHPLPLVVESRDISPSSSTSSSIGSTSKVIVTNNHQRENLITTAHSIASAGAGIDVTSSTNGNSKNSPHHLALSSSSVISNLSARSFLLNSTSLVKVNCDSDSSSVSPSSFSSSQISKSTPSKTGESEKTYRKPSSKEIDSKGVTNDEKIKLERKRERNRQAAAKCRNKKIQRINELEAQKTELTNEKEKLLKRISEVNDQIDSLQKCLRDHCKSNCSLRTPHFGNPVLSNSKKIVTSPAALLNSTTILTPLK